MSPSVSQIWRTAEAKRLPCSSASSYYIACRCVASEQSQSFFFYSLLSILPLKVRGRPIGRHGPCRFLSQRSIARRIGLSLTVDISCKIGTNFVVLVMSWLHVGGEKGFCLFSSIGMGTKLNRRHWDFVKRLAAYYLVGGWNSQLFFLWQPAPAIPPF